MTILTYTHRLSSFRLHHRGIKISQIACLSRVTGAQLRDLLIVIDVNSESCLPLINHLVNIEHLTLYFHMDYPPVLNHPVGLILPRVTSFSFICMGNFTLNFARFLRACEIKRASRIHLEVPDTDDEHVHTLSNFFGDRTDVLEELSINMPLGIIGLMVDAILGSTRRLVFTTLVPPVNLMNAWSRRHPVRELIVRTSTSGSTLWPLLDSLGTSDQRRFEGAELTLFINVEQNNRFSWDIGHQSSSLASFIGKLVYHARLLKKKHVLILDEDGQTLFG
jgi:hypothetical protein